MHSCSSEKMAQWGLLALRIALGMVFIYHGWLKLSNMAGTGAFFESLKLPMPLFWAWLVALVEFIGGIALLLGIFMRKMTVLLIIDMVVALLLAHTKMPYQTAELPIAVLGGLLALYGNGGGTFALMHEHRGCDDGHCETKAGHDHGKEEEGCCGGGCGSCSGHCEEKKDV